MDLSRGLGDVYKRQELRRLGARVETGRFRTDMKVALVNDGPVTVTINV
jgi:D-tyrosyl-tRNA(Tyr) deacylase